MDEGRKGVEIGQPGALPAGRSPVRRERLLEAQLPLAGWLCWHGKISGPAWIGRQACSRT